MESGGGRFAGLTERGLTVDGGRWTVEDGVF